MTHRNRWKNDGKWWNNGKWHTETLHYPYGKWWKHDRMENDGLWTIECITMYQTFWWFAMKHVGIFHLATWNHPKVYFIRYWYWKWIGTRFKHRDRQLDIGDVFLGSFLFLEIPTSMQFLDCQGSVIEIGFRCWTMLWSAKRWLSVAQRSVGIADGHCGAFHKCG